MRRFASVFNSKRLDKNDQPSEVRSTKKFHANSGTAVLPSVSTPVLSVVTNPSASSTSSAYSSSIRTPEDDPHTPSARSRTSMRKSWISWLGRSKSSSRKLLPSPSKTDISPSLGSPPLPTRQPPPSGGRQMAIKPRAIESEGETSDDEEEDDEDEYEEQTERLKTTTVDVLNLTPASIAHARQYLVLLTTNALSHQPSSSPFHHYPSCLPFPRSSNQAFLPPASSNLRINVLRTHLLHHVRTSHPTQVQGILPFAARDLPSVSDRLPVDPIDERALAPQNQVQHTSAGLKRWMSRPPFEDRYDVWYPTSDMPGQFQRRAVPGTRFAVPDLEFSLALEAMAGDYGTDGILTSNSHIPAVPSEAISLPDFSGFEPPSLAMINTGSELMVPEVVVTTYSEDVKLKSDTTPSTAELQILPTQARSGPSTQTVSQDDSSTLNMPARTYRAVPSPLRIQHDPSTLQGPSQAETSINAESLSKRGVRFAEDDKEDHIPIGYVLRLKRKKAEKARFLAEEEARRAQPSLQLARQKEAQKLESERRQRVAERNEWEKERRAWEREKKVMEEERNQRKYAEEVAAARVRRENVRAGNVPGAANGSANSSPWAAPSSYSSESVRSRNRDSKRMSRPSLDTVLPAQSLPQISTYSGFQAESRRQLSEFATSSNTNSTGSPYDSSPSSSRPPSGETPMSTPPSGSPDRSRPTSLSSSQQASAEDLRMRHHKRSSRSASERGSPSVIPMQIPYGWSYGPGYVIPSVPALPPFAMDVPLLPPSAPFMVQQYPRPRSQVSGSPGSSGHSSSSKSWVLSTRSEESSNSNRRSQIRQASAPVLPETGSPSGSGGFDMGRGSARGSSADLHERGRSSNSSGDNGSRQSSQTRSRPTSHSSLRGIPTQMYVGPIYLQNPSPWTAPPTAAQLGSGYGSTGNLMSMNGGNSRPTSLNGRQPYGRRQTAFS